MWPSGGRVEKVKSNEEKKQNLVTIDENAAEVESTIDNISTEHQWEYQQSINK